MSETVLDDNDVVCMEVGQNFAKTSTSKLKEIRQAMIRDFLANYGNWLGDGIYCQVLQPGKDWQTGKIRLRIEFIPNNPVPPKTNIHEKESSPLDDLRLNLDD